MEQDSFWINTLRRSSVSQAHVVAEGEEQGWGCYLFPAQTWFLLPQLGVLLSETHARFSRWPFCSCASVVLGQTWEERKCCQHLYPQNTHSHTMSREAQGCHTHRCNDLGPKLSLNVSSVCFRVVYVWMAAHVCIQAGRHTRKHAHT